MGAGKTFSDLTPQGSLNGGQVSVLNWSFCHHLTDFLPWRRLIRNDQCDGMLSSPPPQTPGIKTQTVEVHVPDCAEETVRTAWN